MGSSVATDWVPPSGGSLEIGNSWRDALTRSRTGSPFGGIPRNWKPEPNPIPPWEWRSSPFGGIPRNWKHEWASKCMEAEWEVPPSGGSLEIGNRTETDPEVTSVRHTGSPFGGIPRNWKLGSQHRSFANCSGSPFGGIPRNWKRVELGEGLIRRARSPFGGIPRNWKLQLTPCSCYPN